MSGRLPSQESPSPPTGWIAYRSPNMQPGNPDTPSDFLNDIPLAQAANQVAMRAYCEGFSDVAGILFTRCAQRARCAAGVLNYLLLMEIVAEISVLLHHGRRSSYRRLKGFGVPSIGVLGNVVVV